MPQIAAGTVQGPIGAVPCAHCGQPMDLSELQEQLGHGVTLECDYCGRGSEIVDVRKVYVVRQA